MACNAQPYAITNAILAAKQAGFSGQSLLDVVSIAMAESCLNNNAKHINTDGSIDRGVLQINSRFHPEVSDTCAYNEACAFQASFKISSQGKDFNPWTTYKSGAYQSNLPTVSGITGIQTIAGGAKGAVNTSSSNLPGAGCGLDVGCYWASFQPLLISWGEHIAIFVLAILLVIVGLVLVGSNPVAGAVQKVGA